MRGSDETSPERDEPVGRRVFQNFGFLTTGKVAGDIFTFALFVMLSRAYGQEGIGKYSFAIAFTGFFAVFADFGLYALSIKELSRPGRSIREAYGEVFSLRLILSVAAYGVMLLVLLLLPFPSGTKLILCIVGAYQILTQVSGGLSGLFVAREDAHLAGGLEILLRGMTAIAGITVVAIGGTLTQALLTLPAASLAHVLLAYAVARAKYGRLRLVMRLPILVHLARRAIPYAQSMFLVQIYSRVDVVLLGFILGDAAAGIYNVAYRVLFLLLFIPHIATVAVLPLASRLHHEGSREKLKSLYSESLNHAVLAGLPMATGLWLIAPDLIDVVYGEDFHDAIVVLELISWLLFLAFLSRIIAGFLTACDGQPNVARCQWAAAFANLIGNAILIPTVGVLGAGIATLTSEALLVVLLAVRLHAVLGWPKMLSRIAIATLGSTAFALPLYLLSDRTLIVAVPTAIIIYVVILVSFRTIRHNEMRAILGVLR